MKRITISLIVMISMLLTSCGNISEKDNAANTSAEVTTTTVAEDTSSVTTTSETEETSEAVTTTTRTEKDDSSSQAETTAATTSKKSTTTSKKSSGKVKITSSGRTGSSNNSNNGGGYSGGGNVVTQAPAQQQAAPTQTTTTTQPPVKKTTTTTTTQYIPEPEPIPEPVAPNTSIVDIDMTDDQMYVFLTLYPIDYEVMYQAGQNLSYDGTNYGKAKAVCEYAYNCGGRNCIEYALNAYFVAQGASLECYLARSSQYDWYGHVANIVNIDGQYYYMEPMTNETTANTAIAFGGYRADGSGIIDPVPLDIFFDIYDNRYSLDVSSSKYGE
ncbi:hypothetical protein [Ruminococcus albus]|uniref:hypothetical protein n=1 Tax=Ruminococcus albus TaxID=1264 RepID=UPI0004642E92|nr:hypothetical protein [Ruminococcus albus]